MEQQDISLTLWSYIDGQLSPSETMEVEKLIREHAAWKEEYHSLLEIQKSLNLSELEEPSLRFTKNVMELISREQIAPAAKSYINNKIILGIGTFFVLMILGFLAYGFSQINWSAAADSSYSIGIDPGKLDFSNMFNNNFVNVFLMLNVVVGLFLLDRYLTSRKNFLHENQIHS